MNAIDWAVRPLKDYAKFKGRSPRPEFWWFLLLQTLAFTLLGLLLSMRIGLIDPETGGLAPSLQLAMIVAMLPVLLPTIAVQVRRLHDQDLSGWLVVLFYIPYVGIFVALVFMALRGTRGPNRYGPDPCAESRTRYA